MAMAPGLQPAVDGSVCRGKPVARVRSPPPPPLWKRTTPRLLSWNIGDLSNCVKERPEATPRPAGMAPEVLGMDDQVVAVLADACLYWRSNRRERSSGRGNDCPYREPD